MAPKKLPLPPLSKLKPFRSFLFLKLPGSSVAEDRVQALRNAIVDLVADLAGAGPATLSPRSRRGDVFSALAVYSRERRAPWTSDGQIIDLEHQLVAVSGYRGWCAVFISDPGLRLVVHTNLTEAVGAFKEFQS